MANRDMGRLRGIIELIGAGAVLLGLIFVGIELRQNTAAVEAASIDGLTNLSQDFFLILASDQELARIWDIGQEDMSKLNESERSRFLWILRSRLVRWQSAFLQWRRGTLGDEDWAYYRALICDSTQQESWPLVRVGFLPDFVEYAESC